ncbi:MAG: S-layer homology domain-containing protein [Candidatus Peribacteraceae bacterium]
MRFLSTFVVLLLLPLAATARSYDIENLPYSDAPQDMPTAIAVSTLTTEGVLQGNPDGTFRPDNDLNRAEFMKIAMALVPGTLDVTTSCFPDVPLGAWFTEPICRAKEQGIVNGNALLGLAPEHWPFQPERSVQYEEAVKVLAGVFNIPVMQCAQCGGEWYEPYLAAAEERQINLPDVQPGHRLTRGEMALLTVQFLAYKDGELANLFQAEQGIGLEQQDAEDQEIDHCIPIVCSDDRVFPACDSSGEIISYDTPPCDTPVEEETSSQSSSSSVQYDPDSNMSTASNFLMLGSVGPVLGAADVFSNTEPLNVTKMQVVLVDAVTSIEAFHVYDHDGKYLGRAYKDSVVNERTYTLNVSNGTVTIPYRDSYSFYVRPQMSAYKSGGVSGEVVQVQGLYVEGDGEWSNRSYQKNTGETYNKFQTSRSHILSIRNAGVDNDVLISGTDMELGSFLFEGITGDGSADLRVTDLVFQVEAGGGVSVSSVTLGADATTERSSCSLVSTTLTCASIPAQFGTFKSGPRTLTLYGNVTVPDVQNAALRLSINQAGSVLIPGSVTWTDGTSTFEWIQGGSPVARGTYMTQ